MLAVNTTLSPRILARFTSAATSSREYVACGAEQVRTPVAMTFCYGGAG